MLSQTPNKGEGEDGDKLPYPIYQVYDAMLKRMVNTCLWAAWAIDHNQANKGDVGDQIIPVEISKALRSASEDLSTPSNPEEGESIAFTTASLLVSIEYCARNYFIEEDNPYPLDRDWYRKHLIEAITQYEEFISRKTEPAEEVDHDRTS